MHSISSLKKSKKFERKAISIDQVGMRGSVEPQAGMLCLISPESRVPKDHPLRRI